MCDGLPVNLNEQKNFSDLFPFILFSKLAICHNCYVVKSLQVVKYLYKLLICTTHVCDDRAHD